MAPISAQHQFAIRLFRRAVSYTGTGFSTFLLDLSILLALIHLTTTPYQSAVAISFLIGISVNYLICYRFIYQGTERNVFLGYAIFALIAVGGIAIIVPSVTFLVEDAGFNVFVARTIVGIFIGSIDFLINTFFNFKVV